MTVSRNPESRTAHDAHRLEMIRLVEEVDTRAGIGAQPLMTGEEVQEMMRTSGVREVDNGLSREIISMRRGADEGED